MFRKVLFWSHLACGLCAGIVVFIMSVTGVMLTYEKQLLAWADRSAAQIQPPPAAALVNTSTALDSVRARFPDRTPTALTRRSDPRAPITVTLDESTPAELVVTMHSIARGKRLVTGVVTDARGKDIGLSMWTGYSENERTALSLGTVDPDVEIGTEVRVIWGEPGGGTKKATVERHEQLAVRAIVSPAPYSVVARKEYQEGWRTASS